MQVVSAGSESCRLKVELHVECLEVELAEVCEVSAPTMMDDYCSASRVCEASPQRGVGSLTRGEAIYPSHLSTTFLLPCGVVMWYCPQAQATGGAIDEVGPRPPDRTYPTDERRSDGGAVDSGDPTPTLPNPNPNRYDRVKTNPTYQCKKKKRLMPSEPTATCIDRPLSTNTAQSRPPKEPHTNTQ